MINNSASYNRRDFSQMLQNTNQCLLFEKNKMNLQLHKLPPLAREYTNIQCRFISVFKDKNKTNSFQNILDIFKLNITIHSLQETVKFVTSHQKHSKRQNILQRFLKLYTYHAIQVKYITEQVVDIIVKTQVGCKSWL